MTRQQTNGAIFFLLDSAASVEKGKKQNKRRNKAVEKNKLLQWGYPVLRVQARNKAKGNHRLRLADPNSYTCVSRWIILITGCWRTKPETPLCKAAQEMDGSWARARLMQQPWQLFTVGKGAHHMHGMDARSSQFADADLSLAMMRCVAAWQFISLTCDAFGKPGPPFRAYAAVAWGATTTRNYLLEVAMKWLTPWFLVNYSVVISWGGLRVLLAGMLYWHPLAIATYIYTIITDSWLRTNSDSLFSTKNHNLFIWPRLKTNFISKL